MAAKEVLFERGAAGTSDLWDDSELIAAWNRQAHHRTRASPSPAPTASSSDEGPAEEVPSTAEAPAKKRRLEADAAQGEEDGTMPPLPVWADAQTQAALRAFYKAGYWAGRAGAL